MAAAAPPPPAAVALDFRSVPVDGPPITLERKFEPCNTAGLTGLAAGTNFTYQFQNVQSVDETKLKSHMAKEMDTAGWQNKTERTVGAKAGVKVGIPFIGSFEFGGSAGSATTSTSSGSHIIEKGFNESLTSATGTVTTEGFLISTTVSPGTKLFVFREVWTGPGIHLQMPLIVLEEAKDLAAARAMLPTTVDLTVTITPKLQVSARTLRLPCRLQHVSLAPRILRSLSIYCVRHLLRSKRGALSSARRVRGTCWRRSRARLSKKVEGFSSPRATDGKTRSGSSRRMAAL